MENVQVEKIDGNSQGEGGKSGSAGIVEVKRRSPKREGLVVLNTSGRSNG